MADDNNEFIEKAKSIGVSLKRGTSRKKPVVDERDGSQAGYEVEHWDDRQDAVVQAKTIEADFKVHKPGEE
jgi:hypothetical protein